MGLFRPLPSEDIAFSMRMVELLTSFARTGKPSIVMGEDQPPFSWDHVNAANASHLNIGNMMMMDQVKFHKVINTLDALYLPHLKHHILSVISS